MRRPRRQKLEQRRQVRSRHPFVTPCRRTVSAAPGYPGTQLCPAPEHAATARVVVLAGLDNLTGYKELGDFVKSLQKPRRIILLVKAGKPVDATIEGLMQHLEEGDIIIDGGNEWYENSERRMEMVAKQGIRYMAMGVSGGEEGARRGQHPISKHTVSTMYRHNGLCD
jgi:hypothetical protein